MCPRSRDIIFSENFSAMLWLCVAMTIVVPRALIALKSFIISKDSVGSRLPVGSSAKRITGLLIIAQLWNLVFPINKVLWSSSYMLQCGGLSVLLMALFYYIIDVLGYQQWAFFFKIIGVNSILIYMSDKFIDWHYTASSLFHWLGQLVGNPYNVVVLIICSLAVQWGFLYVLYKKKIFLRV